jgi:hypothetical protein
MRCPASPSRPRPRAGAIEKDFEVVAVNVWHHPQRLALLSVVHYPAATARRNFASPHRPAAQSATYHDKQLDFARLRTYEENAESMSPA